MHKPPNFLLGFRDVLSVSFFPFLQQWIHCPQIHSNCLQKTGQCYKPEYRSEKQNKKRQELKIPTHHVEQSL